jgi:acyl-coenzyme A synthetase/AMP-(fatty) acid ligase
MGVEGVLNLTKKSRDHYLEFKKDPKVWEQKMAQLEKIKNSIDPFKDGAMIIYTTGSTGFPKPAVLSNAGIICQNMCMVKGFNVTENDRLLVNLPPSHVGCQTEQFMTTIFVGGISVILHAFKAEKTMQAILNKLKFIFGQIPEPIRNGMEIKRKYGVKSFEECCTSSLRLHYTDGQAVSRDLLDRLRKMAPTRKADWV